MNALRLAVSWLTVVPLHSPAVVDRRAAGHAIGLAPLIGLALGAFAAGALWLLVSAGLTTLLAGLLVVGLLALLTRGMHLDGLADTVEDVGDSLERGTGFVMETTSQEGFDAAMDRVLCAWRKPELWKGIQQRGMARDFGWGNAARQYSAIYTTLADNTTG